MVPKKPLHPGAVRRAALSRHRSGYAGLLADAYPLGPAVVAAAVRVDHEVAALTVRGRVEAINNKIKATVRMGYGFRNTDNLVSLLMLRCSDCRPRLPGRQAAK